MDWLLGQIPELDALLNRIIYSRLGKDARAAADDLRQNVYAKLAHRSHNSAPGNQIRDVRTYTIRMAINECNEFITDKVKALRRELRIDEVNTEALVSPCLTVEGNVYCDQVIEADEELRRIYEYALRRPLHYRQAFLLTQVDEQGGSLLLRMLARRVVKRVQMCKDLAISGDYLKNLVKQKRLPMDISQAAKELGVTAHQISKWRYSTVAHWHSGGSTDRRHGSKNIRPRSAQRDALKENG